MVTDGPSALKQAAFLDEASSSITYDKSQTYNYSGEFGFLYSTPAVSFRFGFEVLKPPALTSVTATNGGATAYTLNSTYTGFAPKLGVEINLKKSSTWRLFLMGFYGSASVSYKNDYTIVNYAPITDHSEEFKGSAALYGGTLGFEGLLTDTTTYLIEAGFRRLDVTNLNYSKDVTTGIDNKAHAAGDPALDVNGNQRTLDFSGAYLSIGFRFYM